MEQQDDPVVRMLEQMGVDAAVINAALKGALKLYQRHGWEDLLELEEEDRHQLFASAGINDAIADYVAQRLASPQQESEEEVQEVIALELCHLRD
jgi:hypothetical protein